MSSQWIEAKLDSCGSVSLSHSNFLTEIKSCKEYKLPIVTLKGIGGKTQPLQKAGVLKVVKPNKRILKLLCYVFDEAVGNTERLLLISMSAINKAKFDIQYHIEHSCAGKCMPLRFLELSGNGLLLEDTPNHFDNVKGKNEHDQLIQQFEQRQIDILVGTQMVVKGLDFENVDLVGIVDADSLLNFNQYRVNERAFQMMEQVSGRAGRKNSNGKVLIQVSQVQHLIVQLVQQHDYLGFYKFEIQNRKQFAYPPFSRLLSILFKHKENEIAEEAANHFLHSLTPQIQRTVLGPAQPLVNRVRNKYIWELCVKIATQAGQLQIAKKQLVNYVQLIQAHPRYKTVQIIIDVDPN